MRYRHNRHNRFISFIAYAFMAILGSAWLLCGAFVLKTTEAPTHAMPAWLWNLTFTCMMFVGLCLLVHSIFRCLDELFFQPDDRRRITGRRYHVTRRSY